MFVLLRVSAMSSGNTKASDSVVDVVLSGPGSPLDFINVGYIGYWILILDIIYSTSILTILII